MKALVTGASGLLGRRIADFLSGSMEVAGLSHRQRGDGLLPVDLRDAAALRRVIAEARPDVVVHCAAHRDPDWCETRPEETRALNVFPARLFAEHLPPDARLIFISSDYVFDGARPPYAEGDACHPINVYGASKGEAEAAVLARAGSVVLRIPLLVGAGPTWEESGFMMKTAEAVLAGVRVRLDDEGVRYPTFTDDVAALVGWLISGGHAGIFHFSGSQAGTRYRFALETAELLGVSADHIGRMEGAMPTVAARPPDSQLDTAKLRGLGFAQFTPYRESAAAILEHFGKRG